MKKLIEAKRKSRRGVPMSTSSPTVCEYLDYWLREVATPRPRPTTLRSYETFVRLFLVPASCRLTLDETRAVLRAAKDDELQALWMLALTLGLQRCELLGLRSDDLDVDAGTGEIRRSLARAGGKLYTAPPKAGGSALVLPLLDVAIQALRAHRARQDVVREKAGPRWRETGFVFTTSLGTPLDPRNVNRVFTQLLDRAGVRRVRLHDLRHGTATLLLALGVDMRTIMEILRHSAIAVTANTYAHVDLALQCEALSRLGRALDSP